jgi:hypothetical protein
VRKLSGLWPRDILEGANIEIVVFGAFGMPSAKVFLPTRNEKELL